MQEKLNALIRKFCASLPEKVASVKQNLLELGSDQASYSAAINSALQITHQIKGTSGSVGYPQISTSAAALEEGLKVLHNAGNNSTLEEKRDAASRYDDLHNLASSISPEQSALFNIDVSKIRLVSAAG